MRSESNTLGDDDALLTVRDVAERYGVHQKTVDDLLKQKRIPPPLELWKGDRRWLRSEVVAHMRGLRKREATEQAS